MAHLMTDGRLCALPDGHIGPSHLSAEAAERKRAANAAGGPREPAVPRLFEIPPAWTQYAVCTPYDDDLFFAELIPGDPYGTRGSKIADAKRICEACYVWRECREYAVTHGETEGVWGGVNFASPKERKAAAAQDAAQKREAKAS